jgi:hypothetical protein
LVEHPLPDRADRRAGGGVGPRRQDVGAGPGEEESAGAASFNARISRCRAAWSERLATATRDDRKWRLPDDGSRMTDDE